MDWYKSLKQTLSDGPYKQRGLKVRGNRKKHLEDLYKSSFINRCYDYIANGKHSDFPKEEKRIWREFKKLTHLPVLFKKEVEKQDILARAITDRNDPYCELRSVFIDIVTSLEGKNKYADNLALVLSKNTSDLEKSLYCLLEIGALAIEIVRNDVKKIYFSPEVLAHFLDLYRHDYFGNLHALKKCQPREYYTKPYYFQFPNEYFEGIDDVHIFHRLIMTNNSVFDETHAFFRIKVGKSNNFVLATNNRERIDGMNQTLTQDCLIYDIPLKKRQRPLRPCIENDLKMIFQLCPIINQFLGTKEMQSPRYKDGITVSGGIEEIKKILLRPNKEKIMECFILNNTLTEKFLNKETQ